jgi:hypothetical protein
MLVTLVVLLQLAPAQLELPPPVAPEPRASRPAPPSEEVVEEEEDSLEMEEEEEDRPKPKARAKRRGRGTADEPLGPWAYALGGAALGFAAGCPVGMVGCLALQVAGCALATGGYVGLMLFFCLLQPTTFLVAVPTLFGAGAQAVLAVLTVVGGAALAGMFAWASVTLLGMMTGGAGGAAWGVSRPAIKRAPLVAPRR